MIVERWTFGTKAGCWREMMKLLKAERERTGGFEIYTCEVGPTFALYATELRFESLAELEKFWTGFNESPEGQKFNAEFESLADRASREIWRVVE